MTGFKNEFIEVISFHKVNSGRKPIWNCICKCGKSILRDSWSIKSSHPKSCGCYVQTRRGNNINHAYHTKHGLANNHPLYGKWQNMKQRCYNKNNPDFQCYGGKGISVYSKWKDDFKVFYDWSLKNGWELGLSIDRIDSSKNYSPDNCQFLTDSNNSKKVFKDNPSLHRGEKHKSSTITEDIVREIRNLYLEKVSQSTIMSVFNISRNIAYQIKYNKTWKHVS